MESSEKQMKPLHTFGVQFIIRQDKLKDGKAPVYARITVNGEVIHFGLKQWVDPKQWDARRGYGKGSKADIVNLNNGLEQIRVALAKSYQELQIKGTFITAIAVKDNFLGDDGDAPNTLTRLIKYHNDQAKTLLAKGTYNHYLVTQRYLIKFLEVNFKKKDIFLHEINYKFLLDFESFLRNYKPDDHHRLISNNCLMKHLVRLKKMCNLALKLDWMLKDPYKNYKVKYTKVEKDILTERELMAIEKRVFKVDRLNIVKDVFLFCCYTGLAYIDVQNLTINNIVEGVDGEEWIKMSRQKTDVQVNIPLLPQAKEIMRRYVNHYRSTKLEGIFPIFSNQKVNSYLKEIADLCGIKKKVTFHVARYTFATTVTLSNGVPIETVSKMLGHTKLATTQIYARVLEKKIGEDMLALRRKMNDMSQKDKLQLIQSYNEN